MKRDSPFIRSYDRRFVASSIANMFFSTYPRPRHMAGKANASSKHQDVTTRSITLDVQRYISFHTMFGSNLASGIGSGTRLFKTFLNYFDTLDCEEPCGHLKIERCMTNDFDIKVLQTISSNGLEFSDSQPKPLAPIFIIENSEQLGTNANIYFEQLISKFYINQYVHSFILVYVVYQ